ncbi:MAG: zf-HC2 domain-containing protein [Solirubrobacterales bacterium]|nr:zf-HC2 domain-containing protein [Solirubrobacterales bacterium]MCB8970803.1 zf-HC2 domain-containing protein [Thermoleophilales bacterium]MCO5327671.1 zf-HC2 domain-containing protein [Solirubrobacterales bacterium]
MSHGGPFHRFRFKRDHKWSGEHMSEYLDGEMPESARARIERHLAECEDCEGLLGNLRGIVGGLAALGRERRERRQGASVASAVAAGVRARIEEDDGRDA